MGEYSNLGYTDVEYHKSAHKAFVLDFRQFRVDLDRRSPVRSLSQSFSSGLLTGG